MAWKPSPLFESMNCQEREGGKESKCYCAMINKSRLEYEQAMYPSSVMFPLGCGCLQHSLLFLPASMQSTGVACSHNATWENRWNKVRDRRPVCLVFLRLGEGGVRSVEEDVLKCCECVLEVEILWAAMADSWIAFSGSHHRRNIAC